MAKHGVEWRARPCHDLTMTTTFTTTVVVSSQLASDISLIKCHWFSASFSKLVRGRLASHKMGGERFRRTGKLGQFHWYGQQDIMGDLFATAFVYVLLCSLELRLAGIWWQGKLIRLELQCPGFAQT